MRPISGLILLIVEEEMVLGSIGVPLRVGDVLFNDL